MYNNLYKRELSKLETITPERQIELYQQYKLSNDLNLRNQLRNKLVESNLKYIYLVAKKYTNLLPLEDGIQVGNLTLIKIIDEELWDETKGSLLSLLNTAIYWDILSQAEYMYPVKITKYQRKKYMENPIKICSLDEPVSDNNSTTIGDNLIDDIANEYKVTPEEVWFKVKSLVDDREFIILKGIFADKEDKISTEKIGEGLGISNQRCSQIKYETIKKLKRSSYLKSLWTNI